MNTNAAEWVPDMDWEWLEGIGPYAAVVWRGALEPALSESEMDVHEYSWIG